MSRLKQLQQDNHAYNELAGAVEGISD